MSGHDHQDWTPVTWTQQPDKKTALRKALRTGAATPVRRKKADGGQLNKLADEQGDNGFQNATVSRRFSTELQQARLAKKITQKQLALLVSEKPSVINDYESGKARPSQAVISKLTRALGAQLPSAK